MTWKEAFRQQAISDYEVFIHLKAQPQIPMCHRLHYLQMATEKLAKFFMLTGNESLDEKSHLVLVSFLRMLPSRPEIRDRLKFSNNPKQFKSYIDKIIPWAERIQNLVPVGGIERLNPEYPWLNGRSEVECPAIYSYPEIPWHEVIRFSTFIQNLIRITN
ncbi:hypothetical protein EI77_03921 [Prosthecobacter fusiformis]|uniref:HEPN domain-containing protein n=1 Tax=Prosthecobacter fusiformis TaxID=48464 RepID=A0A4R7RLM1_9BACT|nr:hypothetical protein [Prosthecobacter fusiformis]TDU66182.1 hypothetical protein EI77_03921 [Prosthecobacter fusiformis]